MMDDFTAKDSAVDPGELPPGMPFWNRAGDGVSFEYVAYLRELMGLRGGQSLVAAIRQLGAGRQEIVLRTVRPMRTGRELPPEDVATLRGMASMLRAPELQVIRQNVLDLCETIVTLRRRPEGETALTSKGEQAARTVD